MRYKPKGRVERGEKASRDGVCLTTVTRLVA